MKPTTNPNIFRMVKIEDIRNETSTVRTFLFNDKLCKLAKPGQFVMMWLPGIDEVPMSLSLINTSGLSGVTVENVGVATESLHKKNVGDFIGIRGPFGNEFKPIAGRIAIISGGTGIAPLLPLTTIMNDKINYIVLLTGFRTGKSVLFQERLNELVSDGRGELIITTEDGSYGMKGLITDSFELLAKKERFNMVYTCGPEIMMRKVFDIAEVYGIPVQASLERLMKCGLGICGSCVIGKYRVCQDGTVLSSEQLREIKDEFGKFRRDFNGRKIAFK